MTTTATPSPATEPAPAGPGPARVSMVEQSLLSDKILKAHVHLLPRDTGVLRRDGEIKKFPRFAVELAQWIGQQKVGGKPVDIILLKAPQICDYARQYLEMQAEEARLETATEGDTTDTQVPEDDAPGADAQAAPTVVAEEPAEPIPAPAPTPAPAPVVPPVARKKKIKEAPAPAPTPAAPAPTPAAPASTPASAVNGEAKAEKVPVGLAIYVLLHGADAMSERDTQPGATKRRETLTAAMAAYRSIVPVIE